MANARNENIWNCDTAASIISLTPLWIRKITLEPNAAGDSAVLNFWDATSPYAELSGTYSVDTILGTITSTTTLTMASGTLLPSAVRDGDIFKILLGGNGAAANKNTTSLVTTAGNNTVVVCAGAGWTNEAGKTYRFTTYPYRPAFKLISQATTLQEVDRDFGGRGFWVPNLILETLSSSAVVKIYLR
jgi:hypothetical protein